MSLFRARWSFSCLQRFLSLRVRKNSTDYGARASTFSGPSLKDFISSAGTEDERALADIEEEDSVPYVSPRDLAAQGRKG